MKVIRITARLCSFLFAIVVLSIILTASSSKAAKETRKVTAGKQYQASTFHKFLLGNDYRDLWTTLIEVEVLDLESFAGGLRPVTRVGGKQTLGLAMKGADGRDYTFRGLDKDPAKFLPPSFAGTLAERLIQDQVAAAHPAGVIAVPPIAEAAGILHTEPRLVVMPDDPALGEFQETFGGVLGTLAEFPGAVSETNPGFFGATEIIDSAEMWRRLRAGPKGRIDSREFLKARLLDLLIGDWDRHRRQWRWAKIPGKLNWQPIPEDRDQVFASYKGLVLSWVRLRFPQLVTFKDSYPGMEGFTWNGRENDRWVLTDLEKAVWIEEAVAVQTRVTDEVISTAVRRMPKEYYDLSGPTIVSILKRRRDRLVTAAERFYRHLAGEVDIRCTDRDEIVEIRRIQGGDVEVTVTLAENDRATAKPYFRRRFKHSETREIRIYLYGGNDLARTRGNVSSRIRIRVIGGDGFDSLDDSDGGGTYFSDSQDNSRVVNGPGTTFDPRPYETPVKNSETPWILPRDWGRITAPRLWLNYSSDIGVFLGGAIFSRGYGFRKHPYADSHLIRAGFATGAKGFRFEYQGDYRRMNASVYTMVHARASGIDILRFYGFGNETLSEAPDSFFRIKQNQFSLFPALRFVLSSQLELSVGAEAKYVTTKFNPDTLLGQIQPYGSKNFGQFGVRLGLDFDSRDRIEAACPGVRIHVDGFYYPKIWDVESPFGAINGDVAAYLRAAERLLLAVRVGGKKVFGNFPFHEAAYLGGSADVRGFRRERFAGDASLYGSVELRIILGKTIVLMPGEFGVFGLADIGRVYLDGESSDKWHPSAGGGFFFSILDLSTVFSLAVARCEERTSVYFKTGFAF